MNTEALDRALSRLHERGAVHLAGWLDQNLAAHFAGCDGIQGLTEAPAELNGVRQFL